MIEDEKKKIIEERDIYAPIDPIEEMTKAFGQFGREYVTYTLPTHKLGIPDYPTEIKVRPLIGLDERELANRVSGLIGKKINEIEIMTDILNFLLARLTDYRNYDELFLTDRIYILFLIGRTTLGNIIPVMLNEREYTINLAELPVKELNAEELLEEIRSKLARFEFTEATKIDMFRTNLAVNLKFKLNEANFYEIGITLPKGKDEVLIGKADYSPLIATIAGKEIPLSSRARVIGILENLPAQYWKAVKAVVDTLSSVGLQVDSIISTREDPTVTLTVADAIGATVSALIT